MLFNWWQLGVWLINLKNSFVAWSWPQRLKKHAIRHVFWLIYNPRNISGAHNNPYQKPRSNLASINHKSSSCSVCALSTLTIKITIWILYYIVCSRETGMKIQRHMMTGRLSEWKVIQVTVTTIKQQTTTTTTERHFMAEHVENNKSPLSWAPFINGFRHYDTICIKYNYTMWQVDTNTHPAHTSSHTHTLTIAFWAFHAPVIKIFAQNILSRILIKDLAWPSSTPPTPGNFPKRPQDIGTL